MVWILIVYLNLVNSGYAMNTSYREIGISLDSIVSFGDSGGEVFYESLRTRDGGIVAVGNSKSTNLSIPNRGLNDAIIVKFNTQGEQEWFNSWGGSWDDYFHSLVEDKEGNIIVVGWSHSYDMDFVSDGHAQAIIAKYDKDGNQLWLKDIGGSKNDVFYAVGILSDGSIVLGGYTNSEDLGFSLWGEYDCYFVKLDKDGNFLGAKNFGIVDVNNQIFTIKVLANDEIVICGFVGENGFIAKSDRDGNILWIDRYAMDSSTYFRGLSILEDGNILVSGYGYRDSQLIPLLTKYDLSGNRIWLKEYPKSDVNTQYNFIQETYNNNIIVSGITASMSSSAWDIFIALYDKDGNIISTKIIEGNGNDYIYYISPISQTEFMLAGYSTSSDLGFINKGGNDAILIKITLETELIPKTIANIVDVNILPNNNLTMSLSTNVITFENYDGIEDMDMKNVLTISVESTLPYSINSYLVTEIQNSDKTRTLNHNILQIKSATTNDYSSFSGVGIALNLVNNQPNNNGNTVSHNFDMRLKKSSNFVVDVYKTSLKFEVVQS
jgi:hypothetical protein